MCALNLLLALTTHAALPPSSASRPPNIIFFLIDDMGWTDLGAFGSSYYQSPNIDRLAARGMRFTQAYAAGNVCSPTRASILTGKYPARLHLTDWLPGRGDLPPQRLARPTIRQQLPLEETTLAEALKTAGYVTAHIGKWHLGGEGFAPQDQGFDVNIAGDHTGTPLSYFAPFQRNGRFMPGLEKAPDGEYLTDRLTKEAQGFIEKNQSNPFFIYFAHYAVHIPLQAKQADIDRHTARPPGQHHTNAIYAAMIQSVDECVGAIMRTLDSLKLADNTIIMFTSDNGGLSVREGPNTPATSNAPLRDGKGYLYEGGIREPLIIQWPGRTQPGSISETPVSSVDFFPTLLEMAGVPSKSFKDIDGASLIPLLTQSGELPARDLFWHYPHYANQGGRPGAIIRAGDLKLIEFFEDEHLELYNLKEDLGETLNLANQMPWKAAELRDKLHTWQNSVQAQQMSPNRDFDPRKAQPASYAICPQPDGSILLHSRDAVIHGQTVRYEPQPHKNTVGYWTQEKDWVSWDFFATKPGTFTVEILQGCGPGNGGSEVELSVEDQVLPFTVQQTKGFQDFVARDIGTVKLEQPGPYQLRVKPKKKAHAAVMDLRQVVLRPAL